MPDTAVTTAENTTNGHGPRRATIGDVAAAAGVSRTTVSYVLSGRTGVRVPEPTRRRILDAAERIGYRRNALAAAFRTGRLNTVGIVAPFGLAGRAGAFGGVYYKDLTLALAAAAFAEGLNPLLLSEDRSHALSLHDLADRRADAVILVVKEHTTEFVEEAERAGVPCVVIGRSAGRWQVHTDGVAGAHMAVEHLWGLGHRRIAHYWYGHADVRSARERREGFHAAMAERGASEPDRPEFIDRPHGVAALREAITAPAGPTAVFCYNDELAVNVLDLAREAGVSVPGALSVVGFDDNILAHLARPRLTTVSNPLDEVAVTAVRLVQSQLRGEGPPPPVIIPPGFTVRESTTEPAERGRRFITPPA